MSNRSARRSGSVLELPVASEPDGDKPPPLGFSTETGWDLPPDLAEELAFGLKVLEIDGRDCEALRALARRFAGSRFRGCLPTQKVAVAAGRAAAEEGLTNLRFSTRRSLFARADAPRFDLVLVASACPAGRLMPVLRAGRAVLADDGVLLVRLGPASDDAVGRIADGLGRLGFGHVQIRTSSRRGAVDLLARPSAPAELDLTARRAQARRRDGASSQEA